MKDSFFQKIIRVFSPGYGKVKDKPKQLTHGATWDSPYGVRRTFDPLNALSAFAGHGYTNAAASRASEDLSALPLVFSIGKGKKEQIIDRGPVHDLFEQPSSDVDGFSFREQITLDLIMTGNCYVLWLGVSKPVSIVRLHPEEVKVETDNKGLKYYEWNSGGEITRFPPERIIHGKQASWQKGPQSLYGTGAIEPLSREITADINAQKLVSDASAKGRPDVLLYPKDPADIWNSERRRQISSQYRGLASEGGALVLSGQIEMRELKLSPREMEFEAARVTARQSISAVFGVPPSVLGLPTANYATSRQQAINYWQVQQKRAIRMNHLYTKIGRLLDPEINVKHDFSEIDELQDVRSKKLERISLHIAHGMSASDAYAYEGLKDAPLSMNKQEEQEQEEESKILNDYVYYLTLTRSVPDFHNLPVSSEPYNPTDRKKSEIEDEILGLNEDWERYKKAHLWFDNENQNTKAGYKLPIARMNDGVLTVFRDKLGDAIAALNGARGGVDISDEDRRQAWNLAAQYYQKFEEEPPPLKKKVGDENPTNFPQAGDDLKVSLRNSEHQVFDLNYAENIKKNHPEIWELGGNILGDKQYLRLSKVLEKGKVETETDEEAVRLREAWAARHKDDYRIAGVVAQMKWLVIGSRGESYMKELIREKIEKTKQESDDREEYRTAMWKTWVQKNHGPGERKIYKSMVDYLDGARKRYKKRARQLITEKSSGATHLRAVIDWKKLMAVFEEAKILQEELNKSWGGVWTITGNKTLKQIWAATNTQLPLPLDFAYREPPEGAISKSVSEIATTTGEDIRKVIQNSLVAGDSVPEIAKKIDSLSTFNRKRATLIARTEATRAVNAATNDAYNMAAETGLKVRKEWLSSRDNKVRPEHAMLDGQVVDTGEMFSVDQYSAASPGFFDDAGMDINCRCTIIPVLDD